MEKPGNGLFHIAFLIDCEENVSVEVENMDE